MLIVSETDSSTTVNTINKNKINNSSAMLIICIANNAN
jgi:hypothetical protein